MTDNDDLGARRKTLQAQIDAHEATVREEEAARTRASTAGYAIAFRLSTEFVSGIVVGGAIGFGLDYLLGTSPWLLIVFFMLGFVAGILNVLRSAGLIQPAQVGKRPPEPGNTPG